MWAFHNSSQLCLAVDGEEEGKKILMKDAIMILCYIFAFQFVSASNRSGKVVQLKSKDLGTVSFFEM